MTTRGRGPRRGTEWYDTFLDLSLTSGSQSVQQLDISLANADKKGATVTRMLIYALFHPGTTSATPCIIDFAITMINEDAAAAGAYPDTDVADEQPGWLYRGRRVVRTGSTSTQSVGSILDVDIRSQRKYVGEDQQMMMIFDADSSGITCQVDGLVRLLVKHR